MMQYNDLFLAKILFLFKFIINENKLVLKVLEYHINISPNIPICLRMYFAHRKLS